MLKLEERIDDLVETIYTPDQNMLDEKFITLLDALEQFMGEMKEDLEVINYINEVLVKLQQSYLVKDYIYMADLLLYGIKEVLQNYER